MKIKQKLTLGFATVALLVAVLGYLSVNASQKELQKHIGKGSAALAANMLSNIDRTIYARIEQIQAYAMDLAEEEVLIESNHEFEKLDNVQEYIDEKDRQWVAAGEEVTPFMRDLIKNKLSEEIRNEFELKEFYKEKYGYTIFGEVFITNRYGANAAQTQKTSDYYQADEEWWQKARENGLYAGNVEYDQSAGIYSIAIAVRVDNKEGDFLGIVKSILNIEETISLIKNVNAKEKEGKDTTTKFKLLTKGCRIIYSTDEFEFLEVMPARLSFHLQRESARTYDEHTHKDYFIAEGDRSGEGEKLFAHACSEGCKGYKGSGWILLVERETEEIFTPVAKLRNYVTIISLLITLLAITLGSLISGNIANSVKKLAAAAAEIGKGKLDTRIEIKSKDEISELAVCFNQMTDELKTTTASIDELNAANQQLQASQQQLKGFNQRLHAEIAERKQAQEALSVVNRKLVKAAAKLAEANNDLKDFVYIASHDLREPLRKVSSFGRLLAESMKGRLDAEDSENLEFMIDGADRMSKMIDGLLVYSRLNTRDASFERIDLNEIIEGLKQLELATLLEETGAIIEAPAPLGKLEASGVQIREVLQNLIGNAIKYRRKDRQPRIVITAKDVDNDMVRIEVQDNGIGIDAKYHGDIFKMFKRLHPRHKYAGAGIGLSVCRKMVEKHNGQIGVDSEPGKGSTFWFELARTKETAQTKQAVGV